MKIKACPQCGNPHFFIWGNNLEKCQFCGYFGKHIEFNNVEEYKKYCEKHKIIKKNV